MVCPLQKYTVSESEPADAASVCQADIELLCKNCQHTKRSEDETGYVRNEHALMFVCVDCPVKFAEDALRNCVD